MNKIIVRLENIIVRLEMIFVNQSFTFFICKKSNGEKDEIICAVR